MSEAPDDASAEALVRRDAGRLAALLRERGDAVSVEAAAQIEGGLEAFAGLVACHRETRDRLRNAERSLSETLAMWGRVPPDVRIKAANPSFVAARVRGA